MSSTVPVFFTGGTFVWSRLGYSLSGTVPKAGAQEDGWLALATALQRAKTSDFSLVNGLSRWVKPGQHPLLVHGCLMLMGDAGAAAELQSLIQCIESAPEGIRADACDAVSYMGSLKPIPAMLRAREQVSRVQHREVILYAIARLLEGDEGPISNDAHESEEELRAYVERECTRLEAEHGTDSLWEGRVFDVRTLASEMDALLRRIHEEIGASGLFIALRHKFEASTGVDCSGFYRDGRLQPLTALSIIEDFLASDGAAAFEAGVRYFFGHRIPD